MENHGTLVVCIAQTVHALHHSKYIAICSIDVKVDDSDRFDLLVFYFILFTMPYFFLFQAHKSLYLLFYPRFSLILFIRLVFKLIVIVYGVKAAWYFYCGKCSFAVWLCQIL